MNAKKRSKSTKSNFVYVTTKNRTEALTIGKHLVESGLAACVNIIPNMTSIYRWQGKLEKAQESILIIKSTKANRQAILKSVKKLHSYSTPCILFLEISGGDRDYLTWLKQSVR